MEKNYPGEQWKTLVLDFVYVNQTRIEVSNFGRIRTFNKVSNGTVLQGSRVNGYKIIRLKFFSPREEKVQKNLDRLGEEVIKLRRKGKLLRKKLDGLKPRDAEYADCKITIDETEELYNKKKDLLSKKYRTDIAERTIHYHALFHRLVAAYFLTPDTPNHTIVAHLDYDKHNNRKSNLKWMTPEENYLHQRFSPNVMASKAYAEGRRKETSKSTKLSTTKVMLMKKLLNENKPTRALAKQFKVTETQILRIKRGENWGEVPAAK